jgi:hypothetical protein
MANHPWRSVPHPTASRAAAKISTSWHHPIILSRREPASCVILRRRLAEPVYLRRLGRNETKIQFMNALIQHHG